MRLFGIACLSMVVIAQAIFRDLTAGLWLISVTLAVVFVLATRRRLPTSIGFDSDVSASDAARRRWACDACGYDLRGTPNRCPECGWERPVDRRLLDAGKLAAPWPVDALAARRIGPEEHQVLIWRTTDAHAAWLLANHLCGRGIAADVSERPGTMQVGTYTPAPPTTEGVVVWSGDEEAANDLIGHFADRPVR